MSGPIMGMLLEADRVLNERLRMKKLLAVFCLSLPLIGIFGVIAMSEGILVVCGIAGFVVVSLGLILFGIRLWGDL